jgi:STE24 endopeptidase
MESILFYLIAGITIFGFLFDRILEYLNASRRNSVLPVELQNLYDAEKYSKQQEYDKTNHNFGTITDTFNFVLIIGMLFLNGFALADNFAGTITTQPILRALLFFGILFFAMDIISIPFSIYGTFIIEERFGFNKTTVKTYILDKLKGWLLTAILGGGILSLIIWLYLETNEWFWILAWGAVSIFMIFMAMFYSNLIVPLFNKQKPLEEGELKQAIQAFCSKVNFKLVNVFVIDGSKRSTKANAYFTGLGAKKRIVLYDTLINDLTTEEIVGVLAHEVGHYKKKHTVSGIIISVVQMGMIFFILSLFISNPALCKALGSDHASFQIGLIAFGILYSPISILTGIGMNLLSRKNEYEADAFAAENYNANSLINALKKLSVKNLGNLTPHPAYVFFHYSHPTLLQRIQALNK